jgi:hypothetical protein
VPAGSVIAASTFTQGAVARGRRITASSVATGTELGVLRVDSVVLTAGHAYMVFTSPLNIKGSVVGDIGDVRLRVNEGGTATTSSTQITHVRHYTNNASFTPLAPLVVYYEPAATTSVASFLLTVARVVSGASSTGVQLGASSAEVLDLVICDIGTSVPDTGVDL